MGTGDAIPSRPGQSCWVHHSNHLSVWVTTVGILWPLWFAPAPPVTDEGTDAGSRDWTWPLPRPYGVCFWLHPS